MFVKKDKNLFPSKSMIATKRKSEIKNLSVSLTKDVLVTGGGEVKAVKEQFVLQCLDFLLL